METLQDTGKRALHLVLPLGRPMLEVPPTLLSTLAVKIGVDLVIHAKASTDQMTQHQMISDVCEELMTREQVLALAKKLAPPASAAAD